MSIIERISLPMFFAKNSVETCVGWDEHGTERKSNTNYVVDDSFSDNKSTCFTKATHMTHQGRHLAVSSILSHYYGATACCRRAKDQKQKQCTFHKNLFLVPLSKCQGYNLYKSRNASQRFCSWHAKEMNMEKCNAIGEQPRNKKNWETMGEHAANGTHR